MNLTPTKIILTFATDLPTFVGSIAYLISLLASPQTFLSSFWILTLSTVEVNSLLVTLNARDYIHWTRQNESIEMHSGVRFPSGSGSGSSGDRRATLPPPDNRITIRIDKQTTIDLEEGNGYSPGNSDSKPKI
ncbi:hypothetical protein B0H17DRAFT_1205263 [Mycena rosella]|uniref:Uncharacterized protein n=1 Tax=Mycena rosella TaxID=1033263 RepID=A0AAD7GCX2_MYCRO|nr:hypothetical protein B0H17DRAFT_1205263 [Mycena rosella]